MYRRWFAAAVALLATVSLSFLPIRDKRELHTKGRLHPLGHFLVFGLLAACVLGGTTSRRTRWLTALILVLLAVGIEQGQHILYGTPLELKDIGVDLLGLAFGGLAATLPRMGERKAAI